LSNLSCLILTLVQGLDAFVEKIPEGLTGQKRRAAETKRGRLEMDEEKWLYIQHLVEGLDVSKLLCLLLW
jgi:hypothetical protein